MNDELFGDIQIAGFYLFPCVQNTIIAAQEMDQLFEIFKSIICENLEKLTAIRVSAESGNNDIKKVHIFWKQRYWVTYLWRNWWIEKCICRNFHPRQHFE